MVKNIRFHVPISTSGLSLEDRQVELFPPCVVRSSNQHMALDGRAREEIGVQVGVNPKLSHSEKCHSNANSVERIPPFDPFSA